MARAWLILATPGLRSVEAKVKVWKAKASGDAATPPPALPLLLLSLRRSGMGRRRPAWPRTLLRRTTLDRVRPDRHMARKYRSLFHHQLAGAQIPLDACRRLQFHPIVGR